MDKEHMIQQLMRELEMEFSFDLRLGSIDAAGLDSLMRTEAERLREISYLEIERMFFRVAA